MNLLIKKLLTYLIVNILFVLATLFIVQDNKLEAIDRVLIVWSMFFTNLAIYLKFKFTES